jgi:hypothetical protein
MTDVFYSQTQISMKSCDTVIQYLSYNMQMYNSYSEQYSNTELDQITSGIRKILVNIIKKYLSVTLVIMAGFTMPRISLLNVFRSTSGL